MGVYSCALVLGLIPAIIAQSKGRSFRDGGYTEPYSLSLPWFTFRFVNQKDEKRMSNKMVSNDRSPYCAELNRRKTVIVSIAVVI